MILGFCGLRFAMYIIYSVPVSLWNERVIAPRKTQAPNIQSIYLHWPLLDRKLRSLQCRYNIVFTTKITAATIGPWPRWFRDFFHKSEPQIYGNSRGTQRGYSSKPLKHSIVERILVFKRFHLFGFPSWKSSDPKIIGLKLTFSKISARKRLPKILGSLF